MLNTEGLVVLSLVHEIAKESANGAIPFSKVRNSNELHSKIVYDDRKPKKNMDGTYYPVVCGACVDEYNHFIIATYDDMLAELSASVKYYDTGHPDNNFVSFRVKGDSGKNVDFVIQKGDYQLSSFNISDSK